MTTNNNNDLSNNIISNVRPMRTYRRSKKQSQQKSIIMVLSAGILLTTGLFLGSVFSKNETTVIVNEPVEDVTPISPREDELLETYEDERLDVQTNEYEEAYVEEVSYNLIDHPVVQIYMAQSGEPGFVEMLIDRIPYDTQTIVYQMEDDTISSTLSTGMDIAANYCNGVSNGMSRDQLETALIGAIRYGTKDSNSKITKHATAVAEAGFELGEELCGQYSY